MAKIWKEKADLQKHIDYMSTTNSGGIALQWSVNKKAMWVYFVRECSFTFEFVSLDQIKETIRFFEKKVHPSSKFSINPIEHYWQKWHEKLPKGLNKDPKRTKILKALKKAYEEFS